MPMLADLDDPPQPRWKGLVVGIGLAVPLTGLTAYFALPVLRSAIVGSAQDFDARLRQEDAYMGAVCTQALVVERDEALCKCALGAEYPSLDCHGPFVAWSLDRMHEQCSQPVAQGESRNRDEAVSFCACVDALTELVAEATATYGPEADETRQLVARYEGCMELEDAAAMHLPSIESLQSLQPEAPVPSE